MINPLRSEQDAFRFLIYVVVVVAVLLAIVFAVYAIALCFGSLTQLTIVADTNFLLQSLMPDQVAGTHVYSSPFGGAFRGDFAIASVVLFVADWALMRCAAVVR